MLCWKLKLKWSKNGCYKYKSPRGGGGGGKAGHKCCEIVENVKVEVYMVLIGNVLEITSLLMEWLCNLICVEDYICSHLEQWGNSSPYKLKNSRNKCNNNRQINLLNVPGKIFGRILIERLWELTVNKIWEMLYGFMSGRMHADLLFQQIIWLWEIKFITDMLI